ncbi:hypothetical protein APA_5214 [Pseudanabaena sp. lw0831]|nr:hypothetical protein APA_5214 [Pseudanabaena sp. lw0831]
MAQSFYGQIFQILKTSDAKNVAHQALRAFEMYYLPETPIETS